MTSYAIPIAASAFAACIWLAVSFPAFVRARSRREQSAAPVVEGLFELSPGMLLTNLGDGLTEQRVREIVREELAKCGGFDRRAAIDRLRDHRHLMAQLEDEGHSGA